MPDSSPAPAPAMLPPGELSRTPKRLSPGSSSATFKRGLGSGGGGGPHAQGQAGLARSESLVKLRDFDKKERDARRTRREAARQLRCRCSCAVLGLVIFLLLVVPGIWAPYGVLRVVHYELLTEWRLGRAGATNMFAGPLSLLTGEDGEWRVVFLTRCPTHACRGCHYDLAPAPTRGEHYPPTASVAVKDTAVVNSALGLYTVHEAIFAPGRSRPLRQPASYEVRVRDAARRSRQADEEAAHVRCPAEGFTVPNLVLPRPGARASIAFIADNQYLVYRFKKLLQLIEGRKPDVLLHLGDGVQHGWSEREWLKDFIWPLQDAGLVPAVPMLMARGNHDVDGHAAVEFAPSMRTRGTAVVMVADLRVVFLDTSSETEQQVRWLEQQLTLSDPKTSAAHRHDTIICAHIPPFIEYWDPVVWNRASRPESQWDVYMRERIVPVIERSDAHKAGLVRMVLGGHSHIYQRGMRGGVHFIIMGGGGATLEKPVERVHNYSMYTKTLFTHHYGWLERRATGWQWQVFDIHDRIIDVLNITGG